MDFSFQMPVRVIGGKDTVLSNRNIFAKYGKKCLIVCSGSAKRCGALDDVISALEDCETEYTVFDRVTQNPDASACCEAGQIARDFAVDFIIGIGGGSALDAAKAVAVYASNRHLEPEMIFSGDIMLSPLPLILVGTTAGTGSEVTGVAVLTRESGKKKSVSGENYYAKIAFADPKYTYSLPYNFTVSTAIDAFSHATESYFSDIANDMSVMYAEKALPVIWNSLKWLSETKALPDEQMRSNLYYSSLFAGMALNITGACYPHTMGYTLTEDYALPHGFACAAFLPSFVKRSMKYKNEAAIRYFSLLSSNYPELERILCGLVDLEKVSMTDEQIDLYCSGWENVKNFNNTPGSFNAADAKKLLKKMFGGI